MGLYSEPGGVYLTNLREPAVVRTVDQRRVCIVDNQNYHQGVDGVGTAGCRGWGSRLYRGVGAAGCTGV